MRQAKQIREYLCLGEELLYMQVKSPCFTNVETGLMNLSKHF